MVLMLSSRIFSFVGLPSAQLISRTSSLSACRRIPGRTFTAPTLPAVDRRITAGTGSTDSCANDNGTRSIKALFRFPFHETRRCMSKYLSKSATKRLPLNTKRAKKGYYKGKGGTKEGRLTSKGKFIADPLKKLQLIVPDLAGFPLKPYIARSVSRFPPEERRSQIPSQ
ncbi:hypothetical protein ACHAWF_011386 [Thalassiosira exigua]